METRIETTLEKDGTLTLEQLPFQAGDTVEVIVRAKTHEAQSPRRFALRGTPVSYISPFEPVGGNDWESFHDANC
jgi:hypothetical protein